MVYYLKEMKSAFEHERAKKHGSIYDYSKTGND